MFQELSNLPVEVNDKQLDTLSEFVKDVYFPKRKKSNKSLNELRQEMFLALPNIDLRLLPPSKKDYINMYNEHIYKQVGLIENV